VQLAEEYDTFILEDDRLRRAAIRWRTPSRRLRPRPGGRHDPRRHLLEILGAGVRLGWLCAPPAMLPACQGFNFAAA